MPLSECNSLFEYYLVSNFFYSLSFVRSLHPWLGISTFLFGGAKIKIGEYQISHIVCVKRY